MAPVAHRGAPSRDPVSALIHVSTILRADLPAAALADLDALAQSPDLPPEWAIELRRRIRQLRKALTLRAEADALSSIG
jgi:hypothetical protein